MKFTWIHSSSLLLYCVLVEKWWTCETRWSDTFSTTETQTQRLSDPGTFPISARSSRIAFLSLLDKKSAFKLKKKTKEAVTGSESRYLEGNRHSSYERKVQYLRSIMDTEKNTIFNKIHIYSKVERWRRLVAIVLLGGSLVDGGFLVGGLSGELLGKILGQVTSTGTLDGLIGDGHTGVSALKNLKFGTNRDPISPGFRNGGTSWKRRESASAGRRDRRCSETKQFGYRSEDEAHLEMKKTKISRCSARRHLSEAGGGRRIPGYEQVAWWRALSVQLRLKEPGFKRTDVGGSC